MRTFSVFLGDEYLGEGLMEHPTSYHYFCRVCGVVWARAISPSASQHVTLTGGCPGHDSSPWMAAALCIDIRFNKILWPEAALVRDLLYLMDEKSAPVIDNNLPRITHDQHQTA